jgi:DNA-binding NtrC family response regulator
MSNFKPAGHSGITKSLRYNSGKNNGCLVIVDNEIGELEVMKRSLERIKVFEIHTFTDPAEALEFIKHNHEKCTLALSGIRLPGMSGLMLARRIKQSDSTIKVLLLSAIEIHENEFSTVLPSIKVDGFIQKPVSSDKLLNIVSKAISLDEEIVSSVITLHDRT